MAGGPPWVIVVHLSPAHGTASLTFLRPDPCPRAVAVGAQGLLCPRHGLSGVSESRTPQVLSVLVLGEHLSGRPCLLGPGTMASDPFS